MAVSPFRLRPLHFGIAASLLAALAVFAIPQETMEAQRELFFDSLTQLAPQHVSPDIVAVDIDRAAYQAAPNADWNRSETAALVRTLAEAKPAAIGFDLVFSGDCDPVNATNQVLAAAMRQAPVVLGFLIADIAKDTPRPRPPLAISRPLAVPDLWFIDGAESSCPVLAEAARSTAANFLVGDEDSKVRQVQAFSIIGNDAYPALALEIFRLARHVRTPILGGDPPRLKLDDTIIDFSDDGSLRFVAAQETTIAGRTISAGEIIAGKVPVERFAGKVVLIGSSLPNLGGLRASASMPLEPSLQIHADIVNALMTGFIPKRDDSYVPFEALATLICGLVITLVAIRLRPVTAAAVGIAAIVAVLGGTFALYIATAILADGFRLTLALAFVLIVTSVAQFAHIRRVEALARQRFGQYLPRSVVDRYLDNPDLARVAGEERQVTALFTDIEGFTSLTKRVGPHDLVSMLDTYYSEVNALVADHGGMVDKIVGDAVHALFNAPEDLDDHVNRAIRCAEEMRRLTEEMRTRPRFRDHDFGRTRFGIETGIAVLGEVGHGGKLDYTAHGESINLAARLQDANKFLGTQICIGPQAAGQSSSELVSLGIHQIRGFGEMELFSPEPPKRLPAAEA
ncbi:adenylate/guanylate cyclase domain-containing protein [Rhizobium sp. LjRoot30]|uniref:CHASE2 domain-containing protein n=1 Tax=Rhizobium sp. LjRoot30 TaxID=3342320 RepID=UPI003ECE4B0E